MPVIPMQSNFTTLLLREGTVNWGWGWREEEARAKASRLIDGLDGLRCPPVL